MALWILGLVFFIITFGPRYFVLMNFGYGFYDLGLYTQFFSGLSEGFFNPYIPTLNKLFFFARPEPLFFILWPITFLTTDSSIFLFLDEMAILSTAVICANFAWRKTQNSLLASVLFGVVLFSPLTMNSLHDPAALEIWAQPFLALLFAEYFSKRRLLQMGAYFSALCLLNLNFCFLAVLLGPFVLLTERPRWNLNRRLKITSAILILSLVGLGFLHYFQNKIYFESSLWMSYGGRLLDLLSCFCFIPLLVPEVILFGLFLMFAEINGRHVAPTLLIPLAAISVIMFSDRYRLDRYRLDRYLLDHSPTDQRLQSRDRVPFFYGVLSFLLLASCVYYNVVGPDPFFCFWKPERWTITDENRATHEMISHIPGEDTLASSSCFTPVLGGRLSLRTTDSINWHQDELPRYVLTRNEAFIDARYSKIEENMKSGTRLLVRIK